MSTLRCSATARRKGANGSFQLRGADKGWDSPNIVSVSTSTAAGQIVVGGLDLEQRPGGGVHEGELARVDMLHPQLLGGSLVDDAHDLGAVGVGRATIRAEELDDVGTGEAEQQRADVRGVVGEQVLAQLLGRYVEAPRQFGERQAVGVGGEQLEHGGKAPDALGVLRNGRHHAPAIWASSAISSARTSSGPTTLTRRPSR